VQVSAAKSPDPHYIDLPSIILRVGCRAAPQSLIGAEHKATCCHDLRW